MSFGKGLKDSMVWKKKVKFCNKVNILNGSRNIIIFKLVLFKFNYADDMLDFVALPFQFTL